MERHELLERLAPLIPPPRAHQVRYHGVLAPCAGGRDRIVPASAPPASSAAAGGAGEVPGGAAPDALGLTLDGAVLVIVVLIETPSVADVRLRGDTILKN